MACSSSFLSFHSPSSVRSCLFVLFCFSFKLIVIQSSAKSYHFILRTKKFIYIISIHILKDEREKKTETTSERIRITSFVSWRQKNNLENVTSEVNFWMKLKSLCAHLEHTHTQHTHDNIRDAQWNWLLRARNDKWDYFITRMRQIFFSYSVFVSSTTNRDATKKGRICQWDFEDFKDKTNYYRNRLIIDGLHTYEQKKNR